MSELVIISKCGGIKAANQLQERLWEMGVSNSSVVHTPDGSFSFTISELEKAIVRSSFDYWDGIVLGVFGGSSRLILSNKHGYLGYYWGYHSFRPTKIKSIDQLNWLKSESINHGVKMNWSSFQFVLNNFDWLSSGEL